MGQRRRRLVGPGAVSVLAAASLAGAPSASADGHEVCVICPEPVRGTDNALLKLTGKEMPGATADAFLKVVGQNAFHKLESKDFPGATEDVFLKHK